MRKFVYGGVAALTIAWAAAGYLWYPQWTTRRIFNAVIEQDVVTLEALVDWQRVREGIKADYVGPALAGAAAKTGENNGWAAAGTALGAAMVNSMIDNMVSASMVIQSEPLAQIAKPLSDAVVAQRFVSLTNFIVDIKMPERPGFSVLLEMQSGTWRAVRVIPSAEMRAALQESLATVNNDRKVLERPKPTR